VFNGTVQSRMQKVPKQTKRKEEMKRVRLAGFLNVYLSLVGILDVAPSSLLRETVQASLSLSVLPMFLPNENIVFRIEYTKALLIVGCRKESR
jgi:hypothetical protein